MIEKVGLCVNCKKPIYCRDGFLDGIFTEDKTLYCFSCVEDHSGENKSVIRDPSSQKRA
ncbi:hypothetical protein ABFG93_01305 [Pseudalkalibacillus hwajinpoensis]|uniref:hypothetical protein n=1 Tax=Guptibacillus hwajinpoensis TaxID=208199 RepID=UPI00325BE017